MQPRLDIDLLRTFVAVAEAGSLTRAGERLQPDDGLTVIAFADRAQRLLRADDPDRPGRLQGALHTLSRGVDEENLGSGTRLAEALRLALDEVHSRLESTDAADKRASRLE